MKINTAGSQPHVYLCISSVLAMSYISPRFENVLILVFTSFLGSEVLYNEQIFMCFPASLM
jgi:hypothetical protein